MPRYSVYYYNADNTVRDVEQWNRFEKARNLAIAYSEIHSASAFVIDNETGEILWGA